MAGSPPNRWKILRGKGEIDPYEPFLLFPTVLSRVVLQTCKNQGLCGNGLKSCN